MDRTAGNIKIRNCLVEKTHEGPHEPAFRLSFLAEKEHVVSGEPAAGKSFRQEITVELFEPMGADTLVWTTLAGQPFHFNLDGQHKVATGDRMTIGFDAARGSLFGKDTELRL